MDPTPFRRLVTLVGDALQRPARERDAWLAEQCAGDAGLLAEARSLLAQAERTSLHEMTSALEARVARAAGGVTAIAHPSHIGPYRIVGVLGEGGMGVVYHAEQSEPIRREVAVKVVRGGLYSARVIARFEAERQSLAVMDHPNVAHIYDAGATEDGLPYFAMELVRGAPITEYCDRAHLDIDRRLELFAEVCRGVQHAHTRGIIHRDLKPSNILVSDVDGRPLPRIIDFGIAKAVEATVDEETMHTALGSVIGTLEYMSPEQATGGEARVDTRSDVYSLGVVLYEMVTGALPFDSRALRSAGAIEARRVIRDTDPPAPDKRFVDTPERADVARARRSDAHVLRRRLAGDLGWVVMRALEKDPARRYQSASDFAADVERLVRHEPVEAGPPGRMYRASRFVRRHRVAVATVSVVFAALVVGATAATVGFVRAKRAQVRAENEAARAALIADFLTGMLGAVRPEQAKGRVVTVREVVDSTAARLAREDTFAEDPVVSAAVRHALGETYQSIGELERAIPLFEEALALRREALGLDDPLVANTLGRLGNVYWQIGDLHASLATAEEVLAIRERTVGRMHADYSAALANVANTYADLGEYDRAEPMLRDALAIDREILGNDSADLAFTLNNLATVLVDQGRFADALPLHEESLALRRKHFGDPGAEVAVALSNYGYALDGTGRFEEAEHVLRSAVAMCDTIFGPEHLRSVVARSRLAVTLLHTARAADAEALLRGAIVAFSRMSGERNWRVGDCRAWLGEALMALGRDREGTGELRAGWEILVETQGPEARRPRAIAATLATHFDRAGAADEAVAWRNRSAGSP